MFLLSPQMKPLFTADSFRKGLGRRKKNKRKPKIFTTY